MTAAASQKHVARVVAAFDRQQAACVGSVRGVGLGRLSGSDEVWVAAVKAVWAEFGIDRVGPAAVTGLVVGGVPRRHDLDDEVIRADAERGVAERDSCRGAVEVVNGDAAECRGS
jgi:hypothetical protein